MLYLWQNCKTYFSIQQSLTFIILRSSEQKAHDLSRGMNSNLYISQRHWDSGMKLLLWNIMRKSCMKIPMQWLIHKDFSMGLGMSPFRSLGRGMGKDISLLHAGRDVCKWSTDTHRGATFRTGKTPKLCNRFMQNRPDREEWRRKRSKSENPTCFSCGSMSDNRYTSNIYYGL